MRSRSPGATPAQNGAAVNGAGPDSHAVYELHVPESVRASGIATPEFIAEALLHLHRDGIIILENAIDHSHLDGIAAVLGPEADELANDPDHNFNFGKETRNMDQAPPLMPELMFQDVWANPIACAIMKAIMGPDLICLYANGNTALPGATHRQPVHSDIEKAHPMFPFSFVINVPLDDVSTANGSTEFWLGSHRDSCIDQHTEPGQLPIRPELVEERRKYSPPVYPTVKKGSLILRDIRLWHAGVPNPSNTPRIMLAYVVQPKWFQAPGRVLLPLKTKHVVEEWQRQTGLEYSAEWVDGDVDHKKITCKEADFTSTNSKILELEHLMHAPPNGVSVSSLITPAR